MKDRNKVKGMTIGKLVPIEYAKNISLLYRLGVNLKLRRRKKKKKSKKERIEISLMKTYFFTIFNLEVTVVIEIFLFL